MAFAPLALLPKPVLDLGKEILRHLLKRPVVGVAVVLVGVGLTRRKPAQVPWTS